jgi:hypothetical protein
MIVIVLMVPVQSDKKTSKIFIPLGRIHGRTCECKWTLFKVRKGKYKGSMVAQVESAGRERASLVRCF